MTYHIRLMAKEDVRQVIDIDREAFPSQWPVPDYKHELENRLAHYIVASGEVEKGDEPQTKVEPQDGLSAFAFRLKQAFNRNHGKELPANGTYIFGFAGFWIMADEAHITSIAVREKYRRRGIGELLLGSLIDLAAELKASMVTLEVRVSNYGAQQLYSKYGFVQVGIRRGYYTDNGEDALLMTLEGITSPSVRANLKQLKQMHAQKWGLEPAVYQIQKPSPVQPRADSF